MKKKVSTNLKDFYNEKEVEWQETLKEPSPVLIRFYDKESREFFRVSETMDGDMATYHSKEYRHFKYSGGSNGEMPPMLPTV